MQASTVLLLLSHIGKNITHVYMMKKTQILTFRKQVWAGQHFRTIREL